MATAAPLRYPDGGHVMDLHHSLSVSTAHQYFVYVSEVNVTASEHIVELTQYLEGAYHICQYLSQSANLPRQGMSASAFLHSGIRS